MSDFLRRPGFTRAAFLRAGRGFTLIEVLVVLAVMAVLAAMAVPRYGRALARYRVDAAARRVVADMSYARQRARAMSQSVTVKFGTSWYTIVGMSDPDHRSASYVVDLAQEPYLVEIQGADFDGMSEVTFNGFGTPSAGGMLKICAGKIERPVYLDVRTGETTTE